MSPRLTTPGPKVESPRSVPAQANTKSAWLPSARQSEYACIMRSASQSAKAVSSVRMTSERRSHFVRVRQAGYQFQDELEQRESEDQEGTPCPAPLSRRPVAYRSNSELR